MLIKQFKGLFLSVSFVAVLAVSGLLSCADKMTPAFSSIMIGKIKVIALLDASFDMNAQLVKNGDPAIVKKIMPEGKLPASVNVYVIQTGSHNILIDSGIGEGAAGRGLLTDSLKKAGLSPEDIDTILITHAHFDHVGGLVVNSNAVFPKARLLFAKNETATFSDDAIKSLPADIKTYFEPANRAFKIYGNRVSTFKSGDTIADGVKAVDLSGHTPGHSGFFIESEGKKLLIIGDLIHITDVQFPYPDYSLIYDGNITKAAEIRGKTLQMAASEKLLVAGIHIKFPGIGNVSKNGTGYSFSPVK